VNKTSSRGDVAKKSPQFPIRKRVTVMGRRKREEGQTRSYSDLEPWGKGEKKRGGWSQGTSHRYWKVLWGKGVARTKCTSFKRGLRRRGGAPLEENISKVNYKGERVGTRSARIKEERFIGWRIITAAQRNFKGGKVLIQGTKSRATRRSKKLGTRLKNQGEKGSGKGS